MYKATLIFLLILTFCNVLFASPGDLDTNFNLDGKVTTDFSGSDDLANDVVLQSDGKILVVGYSGQSGASDFALVRYNSDGSADVTFDGDGMVTTDFGGNDDSGRAAVIQPDGKIIVAGSSLPNGGTGGFALARYNADGSLDSSFDGDGKVITDSFGYAFDIALQADGRIIVAGNSSGVGGSDFALVRYLSDGSLDSSFGNGGKVTTDFAAGTDQAFAVAIDTTGKIVLAGYCRIGATEFDFALARYLTDGTLDASFGGDGKIITDFGSTDSANDVAIQPDGKIIAAGVTGVFDFALARYLPDGSIDTTFDGDGQVVTDFGDDEEALGVVLQSNGKIIAIGSTGSSDFAVARYNPDGSLDTDFNLDGLVTTDFGSGYDVAIGVAIQTDGNIVVCGYNDNGSNKDFAVARYIGDSCAMFCDDFEDGILAPDWTYVKPQWTETGGNLVGTPSGKKAEAIASPVFVGCSVCNVQVSMSTGGGLGNKLWLLAWYLDKRNTIELLMKEENDKWILRQRINGVVVAKTKGIGTILPNVFYNVEVRFDGVNFELIVDGTTLVTLPAFSTPNGTIGFRAKNTTGKFGFITVY